MENETQLALPWRVTDGGTIFIVDADEIPIATEPSHARFIVRAVNNHFRLLAALKAMVADVEVMTDNCDAVYEARVAIHEAEKT